MTNKAKIQRIQTGSSRKVFRFKRWAIKVPYFPNCGYGKFYGFLTGLRNNIVEAQFSKNFQRDSLLCPVVFHLPFGLMNVMPYCKPLTDDEFSDVKLASLMMQTDFVFIEDKADSFGWHKNKIVCIDYH